MYKYLVGGAVIGLAVVAGIVLAGHCSNSPSPGSTYNGTILLTGDTPEDLFIPVSDIFSLPQAGVASLMNRSGGKTSSTGVPVPEFLEACGLSEYDRLVLYADDYMLAMDRSNVTDEMILVPDSVSVRVLGGNLPVNAWVKHIRYAVVVDEDAGSSILLNGRKISYGSMLEDGIAMIPYYRGTTGYRQGDREFVVETAGVAAGIPLATFLFREGCLDFSNVTVISGNATERFSRSEVLSGGLFLTRFQGTVRLAADDELNAAWTKVDMIEAA
jgi:hypothetical protein